MQAPVGDVRLALAVAEAGALGSVPLSWADDIAGVVERVRDARVAVNIGLIFDAERRIDEALAAGARLVSLFWGDVAPHAPRVLDAGATLIVSVASAEEARRAEAAGARVVVAQGWESGGHVFGDVATMPLVPAVVDAVSIPVVAAGGIGDGRGLAAALMLGAAGVWLGTRFVAAEESPKDYKDAVVAAAETDVVYGVDPAEQWRGGRHRHLRAERERDIPYAGQSAGVVREVKPAAEIVRDLVAEAERALTR